MSATLLTAPHRPMMGLREFVCFVAACMAINALAIDIVLAALPQISLDLGAADENDRQAVISAYLFGLGASQFLYGPLSDSFGRKPVLSFGLLLFAAASLMSAASTNFGMLIASRFIQGFGAGAPRVVAMALVRDRFVGVEMGRVMSMAMMVFMIVPILAPSIGQGILLIAPWRWMFVALLLAGVGMVVWGHYRVSETLTPENRRPFNRANVRRGFGVVLRHPVTRGYMLALCSVFGVLVVFISLAQQIFQDRYGIGAGFTLLFAIIALFLTAAAFINARLLRRFGLVFMTRTALLGLIGVSALWSVLAWMDTVPLALYIILQGLCLFCFGFLGANLNALAMEPMGHHAGSAAAVIGSFTTVAGTGLGFAIAQQYDGTLVALALGNLTLALIGLAIVLQTQRRAQQLDEPLTAPS
ncbi:MAG: multidrug effflux MFS transporter [Pseudomonadota bacterium]|nr:multidrug effflux MFS transporter [Pseudomonadota bacterium]